LGLREKRNQSFGQKKMSSFPLDNESVNGTPGTQRPPSRRQRNTLNDPIERVTDNIADEARKEFETFLKT
jgi:hypothetical protein